MTDYLKTPIEFLKGVGQKRAEVLKREFNIATYNDLLFYFPYRHIDKSTIYKIKEILTNNYMEVADDLFDKSLLLQYINIKTKSAQRGSKSRSSFANLYAIYVLVEDYINKGYARKGKYSEDEGAAFSVLLYCLNPH